MRSSATVVCQIWVKYRWNLVIAWQNVLFRRGSIKRLVLQTTYRYRGEPFRNYFYRIGLPYCVVTRSDLMRVSHSRTPNWKFLKFWNIFDLHRSPVSREPLGLAAPYFLCFLYVPRSYQLCNWKGIDMRSLATAARQIWVKYRWNLVIAWQNVRFRRGSIKRLVLQTTYRYRAEPFRNYFYRIGLPYCVVTRSDHMRVSHSRTSNWKFLKFWNIFDLHRSPVSREPLGLGAPYFLCFLYVCVATNCVIGKALTCVVQPRLSVKFGWNIGEIL